MWLWNRLVKPALDIAGHLETAASIKALVWPTILGVSTALSGYIGHSPLMWTIMATCLTFMATAVGILAASLYQERVTVENKIALRNIVFFHDLAAMPKPSRPIRRAAKSEKILVPTPARRIENGQLGVEVVNTASFPLDICVFSASTKIGSKSPPRSSFPKELIPIQPGVVTVLHDDRIENLDIPCGIITGEFEMVIKYGKPGKAKYFLHHTGTVDIFMEPSGFMRGLYFHPRVSGVSAANIPSTGGSWDAPARR